MHPPYQPPQPPPQQGMSTGAKIALFGCGGCGGVLFLFIVSVILLGIVATSSSSDSGSNSSGSGGTSSASTPTEEEESYTVGDAVTHGDWEITVLSVEEGVTEIAESYRTHVPQGQYVVVELRVKNVSSGPEYFEDGDQVLIDTEGAMYRRDVSASSGIDWLEVVNPGVEVEGKLAFDVPKAFELSHLLVNGEGSFSTGVRVDVK